MSEEKKRSSAIVSARAAEFFAEWRNDADIALARRLLRWSGGQPPDDDDRLP